VIRVPHDPEPFDGGTTGAPDEPEMAELRKRKKEEIREELRHRASGAPEDEGFEDPAPGSSSWTPPPEMAAAPRRTGILRRILFFALLIAVAWIVLRALATSVFTPDLTMGEVVVPLEPLEPGSLVNVRVMVNNRSASRGEVLPVLVMEDGSEVAGPPVEVPARDSAVVLVSDRLPAGDHVVSLLLYDAWREDRRVGSAHGLLLRVGEPRVEIPRGDASPRVTRGEPLSLELTLVNRTARAELLTPVLVFQSDPGPGAAIELAGPDLAVPGMETTESRVSVSSGELAPGRYLLSVVLMTPFGDRAGSGLHGTPVEIVDRP
jgi:hypothetical protein